MNIIFWVIGGVGALQLAPKENHWIIFLVIMMTAVIAQTVEKTIDKYIDLKKEKLKNA